MVNCLGFVFFLFFFGFFVAICNLAQLGGYILPFLNCDSISYLQFFLASLIFQERFPDAVRS